MSTPPGSTWEVFVRPRRGLAHQHVGSVRGSDHQMALTAARDLYTRRGEWVSVWVVRSADVYAAAPEERAGFFGNAAGKPFRSPTSYIELAEGGNA